MKQFNHPCIFCENITSSYGLRLQIQQRPFSDKPYHCCTCVKDFVNASSRKRHEVVRRRQNAFLEMGMWGSESQPVELGVTNNPNQVTTFNNSVPSPGNCEGGGQGIVYSTPVPLVYIPMPVYRYPEDFTIASSSAGTPTTTLKGYSTGGMAQQQGQASSSEQPKFSQNGFENVATPRQPTQIYRAAPTAYRGHPTSPAYRAPSMHPTYSGQFMTSAYLGQSFSPVYRGQFVSPAYNGQPMTPVYCGQPAATANYGGPLVIPAYNGQPATSGYTGTPMIPAYSGKPIVAAYNGQPLTQFYSGQPLTQCYTVPSSAQANGKQSSPQAFNRQPPRQAFNGQRTNPAYKGKSTNPAQKGQPTNPAYKGQSANPAYKGQSTYPAIPGQSTNPTYRVEPIPPAYTGQPNSTDFYTGQPIVPAQQTPRPRLHVFPMRYINTTSRPIVFLVQAVGLPHDFVVNPAMIELRAQTPSRIPIPCVIGGLPVTKGIGTQVFQGYFHATLETGWYHLQARLILPLAGSRGRFEVIRDEISIKISRNFTKDGPEVQYPRFQNGSTDGPGTLVRAGALTYNTVVIQGNGIDFLEPMNNMTLVEVRGDLSGHLPTSTTQNMIQGRVVVSDIGQGDKRNCRSCLGVHQFKPKRGNGCKYGTW